MISSIRILPNPVHQNAIIEVNSLDTQANTVITILDLSGREIVTVYSGLLPEGINTFPLPNNLSNGSYFVLV
ncbi:MAG: T9SS type A sorting domain-containing protein, partial [Firmicutes bacterium]|nr:T9SS type A sorting domain-containing protein [Bacillota bacterium]